MKVFLSAITSLLIFVFFFSAPSHSTVIQYDLDPFAGKSADTIVSADDDATGVLRGNIQVVPDIDSENTGDIKRAVLNSPDSSIPESSTMVLLGLGLIGLAGISRKKYKNRRKKWRKCIGIEPTRDGFSAPHRI